MTRSLITLADGRRVRGYRKTLRPKEPTAARRPDLRLTFTLPAQLVFATVPGKHGAAFIGADGLVTVSGGDRQWVIDTTAEFVAALAAGQTLADPIAANLHRPAYVSRTSVRLSPYRPPASESLLINVDAHVTIAKMRRTKAKFHTSRLPNGR